MVCNGQYSKPSIPPIPGLGTFNGLNVHSHNYRKPETFAGLTVMVVGSSFSGVDISMDLHTHTYQVLLSHRDPPHFPSKMPENVKRVPYVQSASEDSFVLEDGSVWKVDAVIFCTGYEYNFPFLDPTCHVTVKEGRVMPLYKHFIHREMPSIVFIGLLTKTLPFTMFDIQVLFFLKLLDKKVTLPSREEMEKDAEEDFQKRLSLKMPSRQAHRMGEWQWEYFDHLSNMSGITKVSPVSRKLFKHIMELIGEDFMNYKNFNYKLVDHEHFVRTK